MLRRNIDVGEIDDVGERVGFDVRDGTTPPALLLTAPAPSPTEALFTTALAP